MNTNDSVIIITYIHFHPHIQCKGFEMITERYKYILFHHMLKYTSVDLDKLTLYTSKWTCPAYHWIWTCPANCSNESTCWDD